jgi:hypothetical protein
MDRIDLKLVKIKTFGCGAVMLYYKPAKKTERKKDKTSNEG